MPSHISAANTAWVLVSRTLVLAITPAAGLVSPMAAIAIGALVAPVSYYAMGARHRWGMDESVDVWACYGMAGVWGAIATGIFADPLLNGVAGLFYAHPGQVLIQPLSVAATIMFTFGMSWILAKVVDGLVGLRGSESAKRSWGISRRRSRPLASGA